MDEFERHFHGLAKRPPAAEADVVALEQALGRTLPGDYKRFLEWSDGIEGDLPPECYLRLWSVAEIVPSNGGYCVSEYLVDTVLIGSDLGGTAFGIRWSGADVQYIGVPFITM